jgi:rhodanese-related sulfurtransferase
VRTVGELEVIEHLEAGLPLVDSRSEQSYREATIAGAVNVPRSEIQVRMGELDRGAPTVFFCNGPQCPASPAAIRELLGAGYPAKAVHYYRGGMHDWLTLGLPAVCGA